MLRKIIFWNVLLLLGLIILLSSNLRVEGIYVYVNEGDCPWLGYDVDTLTLHKNGKVESRNFPVDAVFTRRKSFFEDEIRISSKIEKQYSQLLVRGNIFSGTKLMVCLDSKGYYQMQ